MVEGKSTANQSSTAVPPVKKVPASASAASNAMEVDQVAPVDSAITTAQEVLNDIKSSVQLLSKGTRSKESRFVTRVLRALSNIRKKLTASVIKQAVETYLTSSGSANVSSWILKSLELPAPAAAMEVDASSASEAESPAPLIEAYLAIVAIVFLVDTKKTALGLDLTTKMVHHDLKKNLRLLDQFLARFFFYYSYFNELQGKLAEIRPFFLTVHRTSVLRRDEDTQATLLNLILRNYLHYNLYDQADKFMQKSNYPENSSNNQLARYLYYVGRVKAIQLDYTASHNHLTQAIRKAPQNSVTAGFLQTIYKSAIIVQLLMGEIPERNIFRQKFLTKALLPYFHLTQAVRVGDLAKFQQTLATYTSTFRNDKTYTLILRLRHNVIKTGIRMLSLSYSKISLKDVSTKLNLGSEVDAEYIVAKAIRDGVIDATIDHVGRFVQSKENVDIYSTNEPQSAFNQRTNFCLSIHQESVKALRFPENDQHEKDLEALREIGKHEKEFINELENDGFDGDADMEDF